MECSLISDSQTCLVNHTGKSHNTDRAQTFCPTRGHRWQRVWVCFWFSYFFLIFSYLFTAVLGLCCCTGFPLAVEGGGCSLVAEHGLLTALASRSRARALGHSGVSNCGTRAQQLGAPGLADPWHVGSSLTRALTRVSGIARQILYHWATREALQHGF